MHHFYLSVLNEQTQIAQHDRILWACSCCIDHCRCWARIAAASCVVSCSSAQHSVHAVPNKCKLKWFQYLMFELGPTYTKQFHVWCSGLPSHGPRVTLQMCSWAWSWPVAGLQNKLIRTTYNIVWHCLNVSAYVASAATICCSVVQRSKVSCRQSTLPHSRSMTEVALGLHWVTNDRFCLTNTYMTKSWSWLRLAVHQKTGKFKSLLFLWSFYLDLQLCGLSACPWPHTQLSQGLSFAAPHRKHVRVQKLTLALWCHTVWMSNDVQ